jgi:hypothetical protein
MKSFSDTPESKKQEGQGLTIARMDSDCNVTLEPAKKNDNK